MNIKPKAQIGQLVNITGCDYIQTSYGWRALHLTAHTHGKLKNYYVHDVEVTISLKTGEIDYKYLISTSKEFCEEQWFYGGWVSERQISLLECQELAV